VFEGPDGRVTLADLFDGRSQLIVQHFMFGPDQDEGCIGCSFMADHVDAARQHFEHNDLSYAAVSRAPLAKLDAYRRRMGWTFTWVSSGAEGEFNFDFNAAFRPDELAAGPVIYNYRPTELQGQDQPGLSVFHRTPTGEIFHTYSVYGRGPEVVMGTYAFLDLTPRGRNENGPNHNMIDWMRRHDRYETKTQHACCHAAA
jgi:predicted dithiol-disulfide oxidoreductase (DUF899 family)